MDFGGTLRRNLHPLPVEELAPRPRDLGSRVTKVELHERPSGTADPGGHGDGDLNTVSATDALSRETGYSEPRIRVAQAKAERPRRRRRGIDIAAVPALGSVGA